MSALVITETERMVFNSMEEGIVIIDRQGVILFGNDAYRQFLDRETGTEVGNIEGRRLRDLRPGAKLPEVLDTGKPMFNFPRQEHDAIYYVNMYPLFENDELVGGLSVVTFEERASGFRQRIEEMERRNNRILRHINSDMVTSDSFDSIVSRSESSRKAKRLAQRIAAGNADMLLISESGAGKTSYAHAIHNASPRCDGVFLSINCATISDSLLDSELFGYMDGAFPGALPGGKLGLFEAANGGTILLDEISEMPLFIQSKLLHTLQEKTIRPLGGIEAIPIDVRVIATSSVDLEQCVKNGTFRADLLYRLNTFRVRIPPLRERMEDMPALVQHILTDMSAKLKENISISDDALAALMCHTWPGNIRELRNVLEFSAYLSENGIITAEALPDNIASTSNRDTPDISQPLYQRVQEFERAEVERTLQRHGNDMAGKRAAAKELGISLSSLYNKLSRSDFQ